jgi:hypothetical protein
MAKATSDPLYYRQHKYDSVLSTLLGVTEPDRLDNKAFDVEGDRL